MVTMAAVLVALTAVAGAAALAPETLTGGALSSLPARAFLWAATPDLLSRGQISYQATPTSALAAMLQGKEAAPEVTVVVVGKHMLTKPQSAAMVAGLDAVRKAAPAWSALQQVVADPAAAPQSLASQIAATAPLTHVAGDCALEASETVKLVGGGVAAAADFVRSTATAETPLVLLVCLPAGDEGAEMAAVTALDAALHASGKRFLGLYASEPLGAAAAAAAGGAARRSLLLFGFGGSGDGGEENDELFFLQGSLVRALIVVLFTLVALLSGLCCLMSLDTPTRFETQMRTELRN